MVMKRNRYPSNTETPIYYAKFREDVLAGRIPVCKEMSMEMNRIDERIRDPEVFYDPRPVEAFIRFCEAELTKTDGDKIILLDTFKLWAEQLFGWFHYTIRKVWVPGTDASETGAFHDRLVLKRLVNKQYLIVARGAAKSMYASFIQAYFLVVDGETTHQITTAPTMKQAEEVLIPLRTAILRSRGPLFSFLTTRLKFLTKRYNYDRLLVSTKRGIEMFLTGSLLEVRPMSIHKLQGLRPRVSTLDEWLSGDVREDVVGAVEQGASKLDDYIIVAVSSEGTVRNGSGDDVKAELQKILAGEYRDPHTSIFYYKLDDVKEVAEPHLWLKAQPNLGVTVSYEAYEKDVNRAEHSPSSRNDILAKRFGLPMEGFTYFFTYDETLPHDPKTWKGLECAMGADLSQGDDFCSFSWLFPRTDGLFGIETLNFITERTLHGLPPTPRAKYEGFISEGSLVIMPGTVLDMEEVFYTVDEHIEDNDFIVQCLGYDPYNSDAFIKRYKEYYGPYNVEPVRQGVKTESVPLGELKMLSEDRALLFHQKIFSYAMGNTMVMVDTNGNRKLYKRRYEHKIDPVAATMDAYIAYTRHLDLFK
jgi:phage terminase large subunit-like protein